MATKGNIELLKGIPPILEDAFIVIIKTEWNASIVDELEKGCIQVLEKKNIAYTTITVPGAVEIPFAIQSYAKTGRKIDAFIALGTVIKGDTPHFDYVCQSVTTGITQLNLMLKQPCIFGILTVNTLQEALERIGGQHGHKGEEAAITALKMIALNKTLTL